MAKNVKVVKAAGNASAGGAVGLGNMIEAAMAKAAADAAAAGITDHDEVRELKLAARKAARDAAT